MATHIALLRGINVGGRNKVSMADLRAVVAGLGHTGVATYIQSGNVLFTSDEADTEALAAARSPRGRPKPSTRGSGVPRSGAAATTPPGSSAAPSTCTPRTGSAAASFPCSCSAGPPARSPPGPPATGPRSPSCFPSATPDLLSDITLRVAGLVRTA